MPIYFERESGAKTHELHVYGTAEDLSEFAAKLKRLTESGRMESVLELGYPEVRSEYFARVVFHTATLDRIDAVRRRGQRKQLIALYVLAAILAIVIISQFLHS